MPIEQHLVHIPFFIEGDGFTSVLTLNNNMPQPTSVKVTLFNLNGESLIQPTIALPAELPGRFDIGDLTRQAKAGQFTSGNIAFSFSGVEEGVTAQVSIISASRRQAFESSDNETEDFKTSRLDGILWAPDAQSKASLALTNTSDEPLTVSGTATTNLGLQSIKAELGPHATQVVDVTRFVVLGPLAVSQTTIAPALMTLQHGGNPGDLMVTGFVTNDKTGFSSNLPFVDGSTVVSNHMAGAHIRMNQPAAIEGFPVGTRFSAPLVLANTGGESSQAAISVEYTLASVPHRIQLPSVTLAPRDIQQIDLAQALAARGILGPFDDDGVDIIYAGAPGTVIGRLTSLDQTRDFSFDVPVKDPLAGTNRVNGDYPWRLDNGFKTIVHIKNVLDTPAHAEVQIRYDGGTYNPELISLQPHQTIDLDIGAIRDARQPDIRGSVMPKDIVSGQLIWVEMTPGSLMGRAEVSNVGQAIASSFSCSGPSNCPNSLFGTALSPNSATMSVGDSTKPFTAKETDQNCLQVLFGQYTVGAIITWSSNDTSVATVDSSGNVTAVGPGSAVISAQWEAVVYECLNFCSLVNANPVATASVTIRPKITGTSSIWWFGGASPPGYVTATTLTASPPNGSSYQWAITAGSVVFSNGSTSITTSTNQVLVRSSGRSPDNQPNDVKIQVTVKGVQSNP
ncbi:MAG: Ig-like domain-containing protein, partial [Blastocatellia bacterium]